MDDNERCAKLDGMIDSQIINIERQLEQGNLAAAQMHADVFVSLTRARPLECIASEIELPRPAIDAAKLRAVISEAFGAAAMGSLSVSDAKELISSSVLIAAKSGELWAK